MSFQTYSHPAQAVLASNLSSFKHLPLPPLHGYLAASRKTENNLCANPEGWGPLSPIRYDFTPCFLDVWILVVALYGILFGAGAIWWLLKKNASQVVARNWHFYTKLTVIGLLAISTVVQAALQTQYYSGVWFKDFRFWTTIVTLLSLFVIGVVQYIEHWNSRVPNGVVLFFWSFILIAYAVKVRSLIAQGIPSANLPFFVNFCVSFGLASLELVLEWLVPKKKSAYDALGREDECPMEYANVFSILTFSWISPMMRYGYKKYLVEEDLWNLRDRDSTHFTSEAFEVAWAHELEKKKPSLWLAVFRGFSGPYFRASLFKIVSDVLTFVQPQLLRLLIAFVDSYRGPNPESAIRGVSIALAMFATAVIQTLALHQYFQRAFETGMRVKTALTATIYAKSMRLSNEGRAKKTTGDIVMLMSVDTQRISDLSQYGQIIWSAPFQIVLCLVSLYQLVGLSMLAGIAAMILMIPINAVIARFMKTLQQTQMKNKDTRARLMTEILNNMKSIKLYAWTSAFMAKLNHVRNDLELNTIRKIGALSAGANFTWSTTPFLVSCSTFAVYVLTQKAPLTTELVFPALTLFNILTFPLAVLPMVITAIIEASVAINRLTELFLADEVQPDAVIHTDGALSAGEESVTLTQASFTWDKTLDRRVLENITFSAKKGELTSIIGRVGSGKSSLLQSILGDLFKIYGEATVHGDVAYVAQQPWVMNATFKENIVFGHRWDPNFYALTLKACALEDDLKALPEGDSTEVGERGISLSGGQKARLSLARAVYARADVYILDDVLSAVDQHVGRHLISQVLGPQGVLATKTKILATNAIPVLQESEFIVLLREGKIVERGTYDQLMAMRGEAAQLIKTAASRKNDEDDVESDDSSTVVLTEPTSSEDTEESRDALPGLAPIRSADEQGKSRKLSTGTVRRASDASLRGPRRKTRDEEDGTGALAKSKANKEFQEQGKVKWKVYIEYAKASNIIAVCIYMVAMIAAQAASIGGSIWLKRWAEINGEAGGNPDVGKNIGIYFAFGIGSAALVVVQTLILWLLCSVEASRKLHERLAYAIFRSPMSFFETTPAGRILNRFASDIYRIDEVLARSFQMLFTNVARSGATLAVISYGVPPFIALIIPLLGLYLYIQRYYLRTSRELRRLDSTSRSPIFAHFHESLSGMSTIRAYKQQQRFAKENEFRVDANLRAYFPSINANRWLAVRLEFMGSIIILAAAGFSIISVVKGTGLSSGLVGLLMSYALQITQSLNWIVRQTVEVEANIVSVERVLEYAALPSEAPEVLRRNRPKVSWPAHGAVSFNNYSTRYRPELELVLKDINLNIKPREKIGVVGRTGAGKSSLTLALFRIIEATAGDITIDGLNTSTIGLLDLRRRLAIIPQDAALFEGTVRDNLDPGHVHDDTELWSVLGHARLKDHVMNDMTGGLEAHINEGGKSFIMGHYGSQPKEIVQDAMLTNWWQSGSNLSQGQRQLVSLARTLLTPSNILVLDEATAAVDVETDALLQETLRSSIFRDRTIITIAHRINTILDSDRIVVLNAGRVSEFDSPAALVSRKGLFYDLVKEAGLLDKVPAA
ncbi:MAG: hypothetical protein M1814_000660 [Vezdaea aestivalis]|nr:MAG: hypothetical protein M1814_000660 [Vezdaea aestivalis]